MIDINRARPDGGTSEGEAEWPPMGELPNRLPPAPTLPESMIPDALRPWLLDIAERLAVPVEMVAVPAIVAAAGLVGRQITIQPEPFDDTWRVVPNLWGAICAPPGFLKTPAIEQAFAPYFSLAREAHEMYMAEMPRREAEWVHLEVREANAKDAIKKASKNRDKYEEEAAIEEMASVVMLKEQQPKERRYYTSDSTIEKLGELLRDNPRGILLHRDELAGWMLGMEREGRKSEREFFLEAWNGTGSHTVDRISRGTIHIPNMCLSIFGGIQPGKLSHWVRGATRGEEQADGLLQRLQLFVWPDDFGDWHKVEQWPDRAARERAKAVYRALDHLLIASPVEEHPPFVRFDGGAQELFDAYRSVLEKRTRSGELAATPAFASHIAKYRSLMPSLALLFELITCAARGEEITEVRRASAELAADWCDFLEAHARKLYAVETNSEAEGAHTLAEKLRSGDVPDGVTIREIYRRQWHGLSNSDAVDVAIAGLERAGWVRKENRGDYGRPSVVLRVHPALRGVA